MIPYDDLLPSDVSIIEDFAAVSNWIRGRRGFGAFRSRWIFGGSDWNATSRRSNRCRRRVRNSEDSSMVNNANCGSVGKLLSRAHQSS